MAGMAVNNTSIPGLLVIDLVVHCDERGWFKENYHEEKMRQLGIPVFKVVQNNVSSNNDRGVTRGIHAEPWEKFISLTRGAVFVALVDLRPGDGFRRVETLTLTHEQAIYLPRGVGNSYQVLEPNTDYTYLVNEHWTPDATYTMVNLFDDELAIDWPIPREQAIVSEKDRKHPPLSRVQPMEVNPCTVTS
jgi:dTDP-4-dehydrorhamnose 3,5-epimerase